MIFTDLFAASLLHIAEEQRALIVNFFAAIKDAMFVLIRWIMLLVPIGIFALAFPLTATLGVTVINVLRSFILIGCGLIVVITLLLYPTAAIIGRVPLLQFARAVAPVQVIGFSTRSSIATLPRHVCGHQGAGYRRQSLWCGATYCRHPVQICLTLRPYRWHLFCCQPLRNRTELP